MQSSVNLTLTKICGKVTCFFAKMNYAIICQPDTYQKLWQGYVA